MADEHGTAQDDVAVIREALSYYDLDCPWTDKEEQRNKILRARQSLHALAAREQTLRRDLLDFYDEIDRAQRLDNTGGDSAVSIALWGWAERRAALAADAPAPEETQT